jgi:hypothetical protein
MYIYPVYVYAMNYREEQDVSINTVRTHAQTHAHSYAEGELVPPQRRRPRKKWHPAHPPKRRRQNYEKSGR